LALARPDVHDLFPRLWAGRRVQEVRLEPLSRKESARLAREVLGEGASAATIDLVTERAGGNAFFLEEILRAVAERQTDALPETVLAMVEARLEGLTPEARRVLRAAGVFGDVFWKDSVAALVGALDVGPPLDELLARELITKRRGANLTGESELGFRHALVREAAYAMLTPDDRRLGHRLAASWLERSGQLDAVALAEHFERGGEHARAVAFYLRASEQALEGNDFDAAISRAERGVACGAEGEVKGALRLVQTEAYHWRGNIADVEQSGLEALRLLPFGSAPWHRAAGEIVLTRSRLGKVSGVVEVAEQLVHVGSVGSSARAIALAMTARQLLLLGEVALGRAVSALLDGASPEALADPATIGP
jgi:hypothetical protein